MSAGLSATTKKRYSKVSVDPSSLAVGIISPEQDRLISTDLLSAGTRDLVYLILRMSIARLMSASGEKLPLLLDDPFIQFDQSRLRMSLDYLHQISKENQVILFSKDEAVQEWFANECKDYAANQLIELT